MDIVTGVGVLDKAMAVLRSVADEPRALAQLQTSTGLPRATAHRLAAALESHGLLRRDAEGRFELGHGLVALGELAKARFPLVELARPVLTRLRDETGESTQLFVQEGVHRRCVLSLETPHGLRWIVPEGSVFPLDAGSAGRVLSSSPAVPGWVESIGEREAGVASVSAAVFDLRNAAGATAGSGVGAGAGAVIAAVSVSGPIGRLSEQPGKRFGAAVVAAAAELSSILCG